MFGEQFSKAKYVDFIVPPNLSIVKRRTDDPSPRQNFSTILSDIIDHWQSLGFHSSSSEEFFSSSEELWMFGALVQTESDRWCWRYRIVHCRFWGFNTVAGKSIRSIREWTLECRQSAYRKLLENFSGPLLHPNKNSVICSKKLVLVSFCSLFFC